MVPIGKEKRRRKDLWGFEEVVDPRGSAMWGRACSANRDSILPDATRGGAIWEYGWCHGRLRNHTFATPSSRTPPAQLTAQGDHVIEQPPRDDMSRLLS